MSDNSFGVQAAVFTHNLYKDTREEFIDGTDLPKTGIRIEKITTRRNQV